MEQSKRRQRGESKGERGEGNEEEEDAYAVGVVEAGGRGRH